MDDTISIGAMTTLTEVATSPILNREPFLFLREAARHVGSFQIRNMATLVGNICTGIPRRGYSAGPLLAANARVHLVSSKGERTISAEEFFKGPRKVELRPSELVTEIATECRLQGKALIPFSERLVLERRCLFPFFSIAALLKINEEGVIKKAGIAMGVVAPIPLKLRETERFLCNRQLDDQTTQHALQIMQEEIHPRSSRHGSEEYRRAVASKIC